MALENNVELNRYAISNFIQFNEVIGDYDILGNRKLVSLIKSLPIEGVKVVLSSPMLRLDHISHTLYGTTALWWLLAIYNDVVDLYNTNVVEVNYPSLAEIESWYFVNREQLLINQ